MPRGKRIKNPLKFVDERENNNASHSLQAPAPAAFEDITSVEASEAPSQDPSQAPSQTAANSISSDGVTRCSNSKSSSAWNVEIIDSTNMKKKAKIKVKDVCNLPRGDRVIIEVDEEGAAYGEAQSLLAGYCGILATNARIFPISFEKWSGQENGGMPKSFKDECFDTMIKELCMKNKENRSKQTIPHTCGSKSNSRRRHEIVYIYTYLYLETGKKPSRGMMYIETHKRKDGSFVNSEALTIVEQIELNMTPSNTQFEVSPNNAVGKVLGPEHSGRVRCMGMGAAPTNTFRNANDAESEPTTPFDARRSAGDSNGYPRTNI
ncbi:uncharacterized protein LOC107643484 isoform X6 [Arachis ipaensis]|uniref:uncharacterized protein LOC107643484 isoform X6 n=1 Tax=Arachis ipaensis TaxID=130454 RepID=UPI000A2B4174|nr:uncharacterized protein LOC107643484 isoform X6 [Arachis ipaensis]